MTERSVTHATFVIERDFAVAPARVFAAWADPAARDRWFVRDDAWELSEYEQDFRVGGREHGRFRQKPGEPTYANDTLYQDIVPGQRIVYAYTMKQDAALISASLATVELKPDGGGTRLVYTEQGAFLDGLDTASRREQGWAELLDKLQAQVQREHAKD
ncbi:MAG: SRPBCC family protein [Luteimonas sp.]|nr:SRPBCC family protein [Luteimonas sp.]